MSLIMIVYCMIDEIVNLITIYEWYGIYWLNYVNCNKFINKINWYLHFIFKCFNKVQNMLKSF